MDDDTKDEVARELGRLPVGHNQQLFGEMPKPDVEQAADFNWQRLVAVFVLALVIAAVVFLVLPGLGR